MQLQYINVGIIGVGLFGQRHARILSAMPGVRIKSVADTNNVVGKQVALQYHTEFYEHYQDLLADPELDVLILATPDAQHFRICWDALQTTKAILLEKPMTTEVGEARALYEAAVRRPTGMFMPGHIHRFDPRYFGAHSRIRAGEIGDIGHINIRRSLGRFAAEKVPSGSNLIYHTAVHDLDSLRFLTGREVVKVYAQATNKIFGSVLDAVAMVLTLDNGGVCTMDSGWIIPSSAGSTLDAQWSIVGTRGAIYIDTQQQGLMTLNDSGFHFPDVFRYQEREALTSGNLREEIEHFVHCLRTGQSPRVTAFDGYQSIRLADAVLKSIGSGLPVDIPTERKI